MKSLFIYLFLLFYPIICVAQIGGEDEVYLGGDRIDATFRGDDTMVKFGEFINSEFDYSKVTKPGKMVFAFTIDEQGSVKNIKIVEILDMESATEIIRVLKKCPKWIPAKKAGKPISIEIKYSMVFREKTNDIKNLGDKSNSNNQTEIEKKVYGISDVQKIPEFGGGLVGFYKFIAQNYKTPDEEGLKGEVLVTFIVDVDGSLKDIKVIKDLGYGTGEEAIRVLKKCPKWIPASQNNIPVKCQYSLPIKIRTK